METKLKSDYDYQIYANHKQIIAIKSSQKSKGNIHNLNCNRMSNIRQSTNTKAKFSTESQKRLKSIIYNWASTIFILKQTSDFKKKHKDIAKKLQFQFVTLTIPQKQNHSDHQLKRSLAVFLQNLTRITCYDINYVWRAETQENGNIHFHILMDHYFPIWLLLKLWRKNLENLGYLSGLQFINPNCVDIKLVKSLKHVWSYIAKYCAKNSYKTRRGVEGHQWGCSYGLKNLIGTSHSQMTVDQWFQTINKAMQNNCKIIYVNDYVTLIYITTSTLTQLVGKERAYQWLNIINNNFDTLKPIVLNYKYFTNWTADDYSLKHSYKQDYLQHSDDTDTSQHFYKYDTLTILNKMKTYPLGWRNDKSNAGEQLPTITPAKCL